MVLVVFLETARCGRSTKVLVRVTAILKDPILDVHDVGAVDVRACGRQSSLSGGCTVGMRAITVSGLSRVPPFFEAQWLCVGP